MKTLTILLTDGPYISDCAEMAYKIASAALKDYRVNIFLFQDAVNIPRVGQSPANFKDAGGLFLDLSKRGAKIRACPACGLARGYNPDNNVDYPPSIKMTSLKDLQEMVAESDRVITLTR